MALGLHPQNVPNTLTQLHSISDEIWYRAGDQALDMSWYTKRALVSKLYAITELHLIQDTSPDKQATWEFLDRRIDDVMRIGPNLALSKNLTEAVGAGLSSILTIVKPYRNFNDTEILRRQEEL